MRLADAVRGTILAAGVAVAAAGCNTVPLDPVTKSRFENLVAQGAELQEPYDPVFATYADFLFGWGDFYTGQTALGTFNFLMWPLSVAWGPVQAGITAKRLNMKATVDYYTVGEGKGRYDPDYDPRVVERLRRAQEAERARVGNR